jgi:short-subunit dehydrogenase
VPAVAGDLEVLLMDGRARNTALVTGASSGIGEAYARRLARDGYDLVLVARRRKLLEDLAAELNEAFGVEVQVRGADLGKEKDLDGLVELIEGSESLAMLINNAGFTTSELSIDAPLDASLDMVRVHDTASLRLIHAALPGMRARGGGAIINVASMAGILPAPFNATYNATKSFLVALTEGLHQELALKGVTGIRLQALCPGMTRSGFHEAAGATRQVSERMWMTSPEVVEESLAALEKGTVVFIPGSRNRVMAALALALPRPARYRVVRMVERD